MARRSRLLGALRAEVHRVGDMDRGPAMLRDVPLRRANIRALHDTEAPRGRTASKEQLREPACARGPGRVRQELAEARAAGHAG